MSANPPQWAYTRAEQLQREFTGDNAIAGAAHAYADMKGAFAAFIAKHERTNFLADLEVLWHRTANLISYHHADDSAKEWGQATALKPLLLELERQIKAYGGQRPTGEYLLGFGFRIDWPTETTPKTEGN